MVRIRPFTHNREASGSISQTITEIKLFEKYSMTRRLIPN